MGINIENLTEALKKATHLTDLDFDAASKLKLRDPKSPQDPQLADKIRAVFVKTAEESMAFLQTPLPESNTYSLKDLDQECALLLEQKKKLKFITKLLSSSMAGEIFTTPEALDKMRAEAKRQEEALHQAFARSLEHLQSYMAGDFSVDLSRLKLEDFKALKGSLDAYPPKEITSEKSKQILQNFHQRIGEQSLKELIAKECPKMWQSIEQLAPEDQKIIYEMHAKGLLLGYYDKKGDAIANKVTIFLQKISQFDAIKNEALRLELKAWYFLTWGWNSLDLKTIMEFSSIYGEETTKELLSEASNYSNSFYQSKAKSWLVHLISDTKKLPKEERLKEIRESLNLLRAVCEKKKYVPELIASVHSRTQIQILRHHPEHYIDLEVDSAKLKILAAGDADPSFIDVYLNLVSKLDLSQKLSCSRIFKTMSLKSLLALQPLWKKLATENSKVIEENVNFISKAFDKCPVSLQRQLPALLLTLPEKKSFLDALINALPLNPAALKTFFSSRGEGDLYQSVFESKLQDWKDLQNVLHSHPTHVQPFYRWMGQQLLIPSDSLAKLDSDQWLALSKTFTPEFIMLIKELLKTGQAFPEQCEGILHLFEHQPSKEKLMIIFDHLHYVSPNQSKLLPFLLEHPELLPHVPDQLASEEFDQTYLMMPLSMISFIFKNSKDDSKHKDMLATFRGDPEKLTRIAEVETQRGRPLIWPAESYQTDGYSNIDLKFVTTIQKSQKLQDYLSQKGNTLAWYQIPLEICDIAPELPVELMQLFDNYSKFIFINVRNALSAVAQNPKNTHFVFQLLELSKRCKEKNISIVSELPLSMLHNLFEFCRENDDKLAVELFTLLFAKKDEVVQLSFLDEAPWKDALPALIEAVSKQYPSLQQLQSPKEKLIHLPIEWRRAFVTIVHLGRTYPQDFEQDVQEIVQHPYLGQVEKTVNKRKGIFASTKNVVYFYVPEAIAKDVDAQEIVKKAGARYFDGEAYLVDPKMYLDWFQQFHQHPGLNLLFSAANQKTLEILKKIDRNRLANPERFYDHVLSLSQYKEFDALHTILSQVVDNEEYAWGEQLLDMAKAGYIPEAVELIRLKQVYPTDPLIQKLVARAGSASATWIQPIVQLLQDRTQSQNQSLAEALAQDSARFTPMQKSLLMLLQDNNIEQMQQLVSLMKKPPQQYTEQEKKLLHCYTVQAFDLAKDLTTPPTAAWQRFSDLPLDPVVIVPLTHLIRDCRVAGRESAWEVLLPTIQSKASPEVILNQIGTMLYLLVHQPEILEKEPAQWRIDPLATLRSSLEQIKARTFADMDERECALETAFSIGLAQVLTTKAGQINHALIPSLRASLQNSPIFPPNSDMAIYLDRTLKTLADRPEASHLLSQVTVPPDQTSPSYLILRKMMGLADTEKLTPWHAQAAALSAILSRTRQGNIGSCYGTQQAIILQTDTHYILQSIKDYGELIKNNALTKAERGKVQGIYSYPLAAPVERLKDPVPLVNMLVKAREILLSNMAGASSVGLQTKSLSLFEIKNKYDEALIQFNYQFIGIDPPVKNETILEALRREFQAKAKAVVQFEKPDPVTQKLGNWSLERRDRVEAIESAQDYQKLHLELITAAFAQLVLTYPGQKDYLERMRDYLHHFVNTSLSETFDSSYWSDTAGGFSEEVCATYSQFAGQLPLVKLPGDDPEKLLLALGRFIHALPQVERRMAADEPERLLPLTIPGHALCLKPHDLWKKIQGASAEKVLAELKEPISVVMASVSDLQQQNIVQKWCEALPSALVEPFKSSLPDVDWKKMTVEDYGKLLLKTTQTVNGGELSEDDLKKLRNAFYNALPDDVQKKMPFILVGDLNWNDEQNHNNIYIGLARSPLTGEIDYIRTTRQGHIRRVLHWNVKGDWTVYQPLSRVVNHRLTYK